MRKPPHRPMWKIAWVLGFVAAGTLLTAVSAFADDCTDWGNCALAPRNIDAATGLGALLPPLTLLYVYLTRRNGGPAVAQLPPIVPLPASIDDLRDEFDSLQEQLRDHALDQLKKMREAHLAYTDKWKEAMEALEDYMAEYQNLLPGLEQIWEQFGSRDQARKITQGIEDVIGAVTLGAGLARGAAGQAVRSAARTARNAGRQLDSAAIRRALGTPADDIAAAGARRTGREAERATAREAQRKATQTAEEVRRAMQDGRGTGRLILADDLPGAPAISPKPGYFDVVIHGDRASMSVMRNGKWIDISPKGLRIVMEANGYKGGPVRLISCETGGKAVAGKFQPGIAKALSQELKAPVMAPSEIAWIDDVTGKLSTNAVSGPPAHWTSYGMREYGVRTGAITAEEAKLLGYLK